ncbi:MAG: hypothetical protein ACXAE3_15420 [Candidatus Kariarchaeaceae archaeon]|jgi:hypothetical protein
MSELVSLDKFWEWSIDDLQIIRVKVGVEGVNYKAITKNDDEVTFMDGFQNHDEFTEEGGHPFFKMPEDVEQEILELVMAIQ